MKQVTVELNRPTHEALVAHLLPRRIRAEEAAFIFAEVVDRASETHLQAVDWWPVPPEGFTVRSRYYLELADWVRASAIKCAHDLNATLIECHSHLGKWQPEFSWSDRCGLREAAPHVRWRLKGKPYAALVFARAGFDALIWREASNEPQVLKALRVDGMELLPTGLSIMSWNDTNDGDD